MLTHIEESLGYEFKDKNILKQALTHSSLRRKKSEFERLEFLGDRVLGLIMSEFIYKNFRDENEGCLAKRLASLVCANTCASIARKIKLYANIHTAYNPDLYNNDSVMADAMESLIGAIFLDSDFQNVRDIILNLWNDLLYELEENIVDPKTRLQEITQSIDGSIPEYKILSKTGPDHDPTFEIEVSAVGKSFIEKGRSKKIAETLCAEQFLKYFKENEKTH